MKTLVLGIGSPFADDTAGWLVADSLAQQAELTDLIATGVLTIATEDRPGLDLLCWLECDYQQIYLIDMVKTNLAETGNIYTLRAKEIIGFSGMLSSHNLGVSPSLALAEVLGFNINNIEFWGIEGERYRPDQQISSAMLNSVSKVVKELLNKLIKI
ncbi:MAG: hypothetical protein RLZZ293_357 [Pseudomonadota bacterium]